MYCSTDSIKYILCLLNAFCGLLGCALVWFGIWLFNNLDDVKLDHGESLAATMTITLGCVVFLISIFGCVAAIAQSRDMLISYAILMVFLLIIQLILISISYTAASGDHSVTLQQAYDELLEGNIKTNSTLSLYEEWLHCCGKNSAQDYLLLERIPPSSCCKNKDCSNIYNLFVDGCEKKFHEYVQSKTKNFNTISWFLICFEVSSSICACLLLDKMKTQRDRVRFYS